MPADAFSAVTDFFGVDEKTAAPSTAAASNAKLVGRKGLGSKPVTKPKADLELEKLLTVGKKRRNGDEDDDDSSSDSSADDEDQMGRLDMLEEQQKVSALKVAISKVATPAPTTDTNATGKKKLGKKERMQQQQQEDQSQAPSTEASKEVTKPAHEKTKRKKTRSRQKNIYKDKRVLDGTLPAHLLNKPGSKARPLTPSTRARLALKGGGSFKKQTRVMVSDVPMDEERRKRGRELKEKLLKDHAAGGPGYANLKKHKTE